MTCKRFICLVSVVLAFSAVIAADARAGMATPDTILVTPTRRRLIELASQLTRIKDIGLVAYDTSVAQSEPVLHIWTGAEWIRIGMDDFVAGNFMSGEPKHLILLGDSSMLPSRMAADPAWCHDVRRIATLNMADLLNELHKTLKFSAGQWEWLAEANGLTLLDHNAERRRYGRWGAPGKETMPVPSVSEPMSMPSTEEPAVMTPIEAKPAKEQTPVAEKSVAPAAEKPAVKPPPPPVVQPPVTPNPADK